MVNIITTRNTSTYHVSVAAFGAVGDGVTDDTVAVQDAINAAAAVGGGAIVNFPAGTYMTTKLDFATGTKSNIELRGPLSYGAPRPTTWTATLKHIVPDNNSHIRIENQSNLTFRYLAFVGDNQNRGSGRNFYVYNTTNILIDSCSFFGYRVIGNGGSPATQFYNCTTGNVLNSTFSTSNGGVVLGDATTGFLVDNCYFTINDLAEMVAFYSTSHDNECTNSEFVDCKSAIAWEGTPYNSVAHNNTITNCVDAVWFQNISGAGPYNNTFGPNNTITGGADSTNFGIRVNTGTGTGNVITGNTIDNYTLDYPMYINKGCTITENTVTGSGQVRIATTDAITFTDNIITSGTGTGYYSESAQTGTVFSGNTITLCQRNGVQFAAAMTNMDCSDNTCNNNGQRGAALDSGISITTACVTSTFTGNTCTDTQGTKTQKYGINVVAGSTGTYDGTNNVSGNISASSWDGLTAV